MQLESRIHGRRFHQRAGSAATRGAALCLPRPPGAACRPFRFEAGGERAGDRKDTQVRRKNGSRYGSQLAWHHGADSVSQVRGIQLRCRP